MPKRRSRGYLAGGSSWSRNTRRRLFRGGAQNRFAGLRFKKKSGQGVTQHYDRRTIYRKKRMPYRKKRAWKKFVKKVLKVESSTLGTKTIVLNNYLNAVLEIIATTANYTKQLYGYVCLYGVDSSSGSTGDGYLGSKDLQTIYADSTSQNVTAELIFNSAILDVTFTNGNLLQFSGDGTEFPWDEKLELDVYEITVGRNASYETNPLGLVGMFQYGAQSSGNFGAGTATTGLDQRGITPWDIPQALSQFKMKIWKKTKYMLNSGESVTYQMRDSKERLLNKQTMDDVLGVNLRGWTRYLLYVAKVPGGYLTRPSITGPAGTTATSGSMQLSVAATRKYMLRAPESGAKQSAYHTL